MPLHDDETAARYADARFRYEDELHALAEWAVQRFAVAWDEAPRRAVFIPGPTHEIPPAEKGEPVAAENGTGGE